MKFKYNGKTYCVFADRQEIEEQGHLIKIDEDYLLDHFFVKTNELGKANFYLNKTDITVLITTQVLTHVANKRKILIAYEVNVESKEFK